MRSIPLRDLGGSYEFTGRVREGLNSQGCAETFSQFRIRPFGLDGNNRPVAGDERIFELPSTALMALRDGAKELVDELSLPPTLLDQLSPDILAIERTLQHNRSQFEQALDASRLLIDRNFDTGRDFPSARRPHGSCAISSAATNLDAG